jgi:hypothetical protein
MSYFVEYYDGNGAFLLRTNDVKYEWQTERWAIEAVEKKEVATIKAFVGPGPAKEIIVHEQPLFYEWSIIMTPDGDRDVQLAATGPSNRSFFSL